MSGVGDGELLYWGQVSSPRPMTVARKWSLLRTWRPRRSGQGYAHIWDKTVEGKQSWENLVMGLQGTLESCGARVRPWVRTFQCSSKGRRRNEDVHVPSFQNISLNLHTISLLTSHPKPGHMTIPSCKESHICIIYSGWPPTGLKLEIILLRRKVRRNIRRKLAKYVINYTMYVLFLTILIFFGAIFLSFCNHVILKGLAITVSNFPDHRDELLTQVVSNITSPSTLTSVISTKITRNPNFTYPRPLLGFSDWIFPRLWGHKDKLRAISGYRWNTVQQLKRLKPTHTEKQTWEERKMRRFWMISELLEPSSIRTTLLLPFLQFGNMSHTSPLLLKFIPFGFL